MKHLSSRWTLAALLAPVLLILAILIIGIEPPEASTSGKGNVQIALTGSVRTTNGFSLGYQSVFLNVIAVRFNPSPDLTISDDDPSWQIVPVADGTNAGEAVASLSQGGNFGPNGNPVSIGQGRSEMQINIAALQNTVQIFNSAPIRAQTYGQMELSLDPNVQGSVVPQCGTGNGTGEGCVAYPLTFAPGVSFVRVQTPTFQVLRNQTQLMVFDIDVNLGPSPIQGGKSTGQFVEVSPSICPLVNSTGALAPSCSASGGASPPFTPPLNFNLQAGIVSGTVNGATNKITVNAEPTGTNNVVASIQVEKSNHNYQLVLPVGTYDFYTSGRHRTIDAVQAFPVAALPATNSLDFNVRSVSVESLGGAVLDGCSSAPLPGALLTLYQPASEITVDGVPVSCTNSPPPADCVTTCDPAVNAAIPPGCVVIGTASTDITGAFPLPGSGSLTPQFKQIPVFKTGAYALKATAAGYNGELLAVTTKSGGALQCPGASFKQKACNFGLPRGEIDVNPTFELPSGAPSPVGNPVNVLVEAEDSGTFNGENVGLVNIPVGSQGSSANPATPLALFVPASATPTATPAATTGSAADREELEFAAAKATATITPTPVVLGAPAAYDLFASVQDLFGSAATINSGHTIAVMSGLSAPPVCGVSAESPVTLPGMMCVGHGSISGTITSLPNMNTLLVVAKDNVDIMTTTVIGPIGAQSSGNFAICAPADPDSSYTITHVETRPSGTPTPVPFGTATVSLTAPIVIGNAPPPTPTSTPTCQGICSDFSQNTNGKSCLLCQNSTPGVSLP